MSDKTPSSTHSSRQSILLVNFHSTQNAGDLALLEAAINQLRSAFTNPYLVVSANYPGESLLLRMGIEVVASPASIIYTKSSGFLQVIRLLVLWLFGWLTAWFENLKLSNVLPQDWRDLLTAYKQADLVIGCPGNQFFTMGRIGWPLLVSGLAVELAHQFKKPFYVLPQSLGPLKRTWERRWMRHLYSRARLVYMRDSISYTLARDIGLPDSRLYLVPDLAFSWEPGSQVRDRSILEKWGCDTNSGMIGVTIIRRMVKSLNLIQIEHYYQALAGALSRIAREYKLEVFFFPQVTGPSPAEDDRQSARQVAAAMQVPGAQIHLIDELLPLEEIKSLYQCMDIFIASRLHSGIFALNVAVPTLFIGYLTKTRGVLKDLGIEEWLVDLDQVSEELLSSKLEKLWQQKGLVRSELEAKVPTYAEMSRQIGQQISQDYFRDTPR